MHPSIPTGIPSSPTHPIVASDGKSPPLGGSPLFTRVLGLEITGQDIPEGTTEIAAADEQPPVSNDDGSEIPPKLEHSALADVLALPAVETAHASHGSEIIPAKFVGNDAPVRRLIVPADPAPQGNSAQISTKQPAIAPGLTQDRPAAPVGHAFGLIENVHRPEPDSSHRPAPSFFAQPRAEGQQTSSPTPTSLLSSIAMPFKPYLTDSYVHPSALADAVDLPAMQDAAHRPSSGPQMSAMPDAPRQVAGHLIALVQMQKSGAAELQLSPVELGRVRLHISPSEQGVSILIFAERPDTSDLIRRHVDLLTTQLREAGFADVDISFTDAGRDDSQGHRAAPLSDASQHSDATESQALQDAPPQRVTLIPLGQLDVRL